MNLKRLQTFKIYHYRFLRKLVLFSSPIIFVYIFSTYYFYKTQEFFVDFDELVQQESKYLVGFTLNQGSHGHLKFVAMNLKERRDIVTLGSSRVLQFRSEMFTGNFYNAGLSVSSIVDYSGFLKSLNETKYPKCIILGLDQWMFNPNWDNLKGKRKLRDLTESKYFPDRDSYIELYKQIAKRNFPLIPSLSNSKTKLIGTNANFHLAGIRNDGSMNYGMQIDNLLADNHKAFDYKFSDTIERIKSGSRRFEYGNNLNSLALSELDNFLKECFINNIHVIAVFPPFAEEINSMMNESNNYTYLDKIENAFDSIFEKYDFELYNFTTFQRKGISDDLFVDGFHGGEVVYSQILLEILREDSLLSRYCDSTSLKLSLVNPKNRYNVY